MELRSRLVLGFFVGSLSLSVYACAEPAVEVAADNGTKPDAPSTTTPKDKDAKNDTDGVLPAQPVEAAECVGTCTPNAKRCSATASAGTEVCAKAASGCFEWTQSDDCAAGSSCDKTKNDGTCFVGCKDDAGCSAANVNALTCTAEGGRSRIECTKVGTCYQWTTASTCSPDEACHSGTCAATRTNDCSPNALRCTGTRSVEACTKDATGFYVWTKTQSCAPDETCTAGTCG